MKIMKTKRIYKIVWLLVLPIMLVQFSCTDKLDLKPQQSIDAEYALTTPGNIKAAMIGAYMQARDADIFGSVFNEYSELLAADGDMMFVGTYEQPDEIIDKEIAITNTYIRDTWVEAYKLINICNTLLDPNTLAVLDEDDADLVEGEARFLRGWIYFEMARFFGLPYEAGQTNNQLAVPIVTTPTYTVEEAVKVARSSVEDCYTLALSDINSAKLLLPPANGTWASSDAASALLSRIYLQMGDFDNAAIEANIVIESDRYSLTLTPLAAFNNSSPSTEDIFALQNNVASNTSWLPVMYASLNGAGRGDYEMSPGFLATFGPTDLRGMLQDDTEDGYTITNINKMYYIGVGSINNYGGINTAKWGDYYANIPLIRLAEMYLVRSEANFESGSPQVGPNTPLEDINIIRARAQAPDLIAPLTQDQVRQERYWELCWEGHRLHDLKRWQENIGSLAYDAGNLILPIPFRETEVNDLLEQNLWYTTK